MKNKTFLDSFKCAAKGFITAFKFEKKFKIYFLHLLIATIINLLIIANLWQHIVCFLTVVGVLSSECFNIIIEKMCDMYTTEYNEDVKFIKDIAAGGVFCWGMAFYISELIFIINYFI